MNASKKMVGSRRKFGACEPQFNEGKGRCLEARLGRQAFPRDQLHLVAETIQLAERRVDVGVARRPWNSS
jgi:hypothetical protein